MQESSVSKHTGCICSDSSTPIPSQGSILDSLFPLFYELRNNPPFPNIFYSITAIYLYYQLIITSFWSINPFWIISDTENENYKNVFSYFLKIGWFFDDESNLMVPTIATFIIFVICAIWCSFVVIHYVKNHRIVHWTLYPLRFINEIVALVMIHPSAALSGSAILKLVNTGETINWLYFFAGFLMYLFSISISYISIALSSSSVILTKTLFTCFDYQAMFRFPLISSLYVFLSFVLSLFDDWALIILQVTHICFIGLIFYYLFYLPFLLTVANTFFNSVATSNALTDVFMIVMYFINKKDGDNSSIAYLISLIFPFAVFVIAFVVFHFATKARIKRIENRYKEKQKSEQCATKELLEDPKPIDMPNENTGLMHVRIGFTHVLPLFYSHFLSRDSLINFLLQNFTTTKMITSIMHILTFTPYESRHVNFLYLEANKRRDLNFAQRFVLFQVYKLKTFRESSVPTEANSRLGDLKIYSQQCQEDVYSFWTHKTASSGYFEMLANECAKTQALWEESLRDFPNNCKIIEEYIIFLAECETDIKTAIEQKNKMTSIEMGKNLCIDLPFRSFIRCYPGYLKQKILNITGRPVPKTTQYSTKTQQSSGSSKGSTSIDEIMAEIEESLGKQLFKQSSIRIAIYKALRNRTSYVSKLFLIFGAIGLICGIGAFLGLFVYIHNYTSLRRDSLSYLDDSGKARFYVEISMLFNYMKFAFLSQSFNAAMPTFMEIEANDIKRNGDVNSIFTLTGDLNPSHLNLMIHTLSRIGQTYFSQLLNGVADLSQNGEDIFIFAKALLVNDQKFFTCDAGVPVKNCTVSSLAALQVYYFFLNERIAGMTIPECQPKTFFISDPVCEEMANQDVIQSSFDMLFDSFNGRQRSLTEDGEKTISLLRIIIPVLLIVVEFLPFMILSIMFVKDTNKFISILLSLSPQVKEEAQKPILKDMEYDYLQVNDKRPKLTVWVTTTIISLIISIVIAILALVEVQLALLTNNDLLDLNNWQLLATLRLSYGVMGLTNVMEGTLLGNPDAIFNDHDQSYYLTRAKQLAMAMTQVNDLLIKGGGGTNPCYEFDDELDELTIKETCESSNNMTDLHESYRCSSTTTGVIHFANMITTIAGAPSPDGLCTHDMIPHALHILNRHLYYSLFQVTTRINEINIERCDTLKTNAVIFLIVGIVLSIVIMWLSVWFYQQSLRIYGVGIGLTSRLPPSLFVTDKKILHYIINKKSTNQEGGMSVPHAAINSSPEAIICTGKNGVIEIVNPAVTQTIGYSPDQLLGQPITSFFIETDGEKIINQIELMINPPESKEGTKKKVSNVFHESLTCLSDSAQEVPCDVTMIGMTDSNQTDNDSSVDDNKPISSMLFVIKDETSKIYYEEEAKKTKTAAETLLFNILPKPFVERMSAGEDHIAFMAPLVSVCVIDIAKFSESIKSMEPQKLMSNLTTIIESFDKIANKYRTLTPQNINASRSATNSSFKQTGSSFHISAIQSQETVNSSNLKAASSNFHISAAPSQETVNSSNLKPASSNFHISAIQSQETVNSSNVKPVSSNFHISATPSQETVNSSNVKPVSSNQQLSLQDKSSENSNISPLQDTPLSGQPSQPFQTMEAQQNPQGANKNDQDILSLTKCGTVGDKYIVTAGLFSNDPNESGQESDPRYHVDQIIRFALECLAEIEDINMRLSLNIQIRIGIDTGGPIIAGVIGEGKPQLEILGEPIGVAIELEQNCFPGKILVSQNTTNFINNASDFILESKGKLTLKGKGKTLNVFNVSPTQNLFQLNSASES